MRIAITADLHLTSQQDHPERFAVLQDILRRCGQLKVDRLVIAGDLFDQSQQNFAEFEQAYIEARPEGLPVTVIPGNHDPDLKAGALAVDGLDVISEPTLSQAGDQFELLLVPYRSGTSMGEHLPPFQDQLTSGRWALISHGDWESGLRSPNPHEPGVYMPLTRTDIEQHNPALVLLGHIHVPHDGPLVQYAGSPCPLDINEIGLRRFLIFDSDNLTVTSERVDSPQLFFNETVVMLPVEDEQAYLRKELEQRIQAWSLPDGWEDRVRQRLRIVGYAADRPAAEAVAREVLADYAFYDDGPDLSDLNHAVDADQIHIARQVRQWIGELVWPEGDAEPTKEDIALEALRVIWGSG
ncbi:MAG: exonuclease SbcCD subunit D [Anaerolineales bacterium]